MTNKYMEATLIKHDQPQIQYEDLGNNENALYTYDGELFTGTAYVYDGENEDELVVIGEMPFVKGNKSGLFRDWYPSGQLAKEANMKDGTAHGLIHYWHENGQLKSESLSEWSVWLYEKERDEYGKLIKDFKLTKSDPMYRLLVLRRENWGHEIDWEPEE